MDIALLKLARDMGAKTGLSALRSQKEPGVMPGGVYPNGRTEPPHIGRKPIPRIGDLPPENENFMQPQYQDPRIEQNEQGPLAQEPQHQQPQNVVMPEASTPYNSETDPLDIARIALTEKINALARSEPAVREFIKLQAALEALG